MRTVEAMALILGVDLVIVLFVFGLTFAMLAVNTAIDLAEAIWRDRHMILAVREILYRPP